jgi:hypothetical protein
MFPEYGASFRCDHSYHFTRVTLILLLERLKNDIGKEQKVERTILFWEKIDAHLNDACCKHITIMRRVQLKLVAYPLGSSPAPSKIIAHPLEDTASRRLGRIIVSHRIA